MRKRIFLSWPTHQRKCLLPSYRIKTVFFFNSGYLWHINVSGFRFDLVLWFYCVFWAVLAHANLLLSPFPGNNPRFCNFQLVVWEDLGCFLNWTDKPGESGARLSWLKCGTTGCCSEEKPFLLQSLHSFPECQDEAWALPSGAACELSDHRSN